MKESFQKAVESAKGLRDLMKDPSQAKDIYEKAYREVDWAFEDYNASWRLLVSLLNHDLGISPERTAAIGPDCFRHWVALNNPSDRFKNVPKPIRAHGGEGQRLGRDWHPCYPYRRNR
jgi:hypothetical protein